MEQAVATQTEWVPAIEPEPTWSLAKRIAFRFVFIYFVLYIAPESGRVDFISSIPGGSFVGGFYERAWHALVPWIAIHVFHVTGQPATYFPTGSGDTTLAYIQNLCYLVFAVIGMLIWSLLDRNRPHYRTLHEWLRIGVRYTLAITLLSYGFAKVFPLQFRFPFFARLIEPYGEFSPMGVLWNFIGSSPAYTIFTGAVEVLGGLPLFFRRTTMIGAMVSAAALLQIAALNYCYDVPVKLYSTNLLLMAIFLLAPDLPRLINLLVLNRPAPPADLGGFSFRRRWMRIAVVSLKTLLVGFFVIGQVWGGWTAYKQFKNMPRPPLYGLYSVEEFTRNGKDPNDNTRWRKVAVDFAQSLTIRTLDDAPLRYLTQYDAAKSIVTLTVAGAKYPLTYSRPDAEHVILQGNLAGDALSVKMRVIDTSKLLLVGRGFHWINEFPFNR